MVMRQRQAELRGLRMGEGRLLQSRWRPAVRWLSLSPRLRRCWCAGTYAGEVPRRGVQSVR
jgi:hypothetical protein